MPLIACKQCGSMVEKFIGAINRAGKINAPLFCGLACAGLHRRKDFTHEQLVERKRIYDLQYREKNLPLLKQKKRAYHQRTYDPVTEAVKRAANMPRHVEYCRQPEYKKWKANYDSKRRAVLMYGDYWDPFLTLMQVEKEVLDRMSKYEIYLSNGTINKRLQRKRAYERTHGNKSENFSLGNA
jgi:hypothetical protein